MPFLSILRVSSLHNQQLIQSRVSLPDRRLLLKVDNGEIGIFYLNGDAYIKKLQDDKNGVFLISLNTKYPPIPVNENDRFDILGKVVGKNHPNEIRDFLQ